MDSPDPPTTTTESAHGIADRFRLSRRQSLAVLGGLTGLAGCAGDTDDTTATPTSTTTVTSEAMATLPPTASPPADVDIITGTASLTAAPTATAWEATQQPKPGPARQMEQVSRGLVAVNVQRGVYLSWRLLGTEPRDIGFNVYRDGERVTDTPVTRTTNYLDADGTTSATYTVRPVTNDGKDGESEPAEVWEQNYLEIPLNKPDDVTHAGPNSDEMVSYRAQDASAGDLTGDGSYDIVLKWEPSNEKDNSFNGYTNQTLFDGYTLGGEHLWRIEMGRNIRSGHHYTPFLVYDFDGDGVAEVAIRTSDGTVDGTGTVIGDPDADHRNSNGRTLTGPEYLTVFDGQTGEALDTVAYEPARGDICDWGDCHGNRGDRFLGGVAYLDGKRPSIVNGRGYYAKTMLAAFDFRGGEISERWVFDSEDGNEAYAGQGNHQLSVADVDGDGKDEIVYGAMVVDHDGTGLYSTGWGHGDALHVGDLDPDRAGLEVFQPHESEGKNPPYQATFRDAGTGELIWGVPPEQDPGFAIAADIDPNYRGAECWVDTPEPSIVGLRNVDGERIGTPPEASKMAIWWTGDLRREIIGTDGDSGKIDKWRPEAGIAETLTVFDETTVQEGKPCLMGDLLGDWREEVIWPARDSTALRLYTTTYPTAYRIPTLVHDSMYRTGIAWQNSAYNQPPHPSFYLGTGMQAPPSPDIDPIEPDRD